MLLSSPMRITMEARLFNQSPRPCFRRLTPSQPRRPRQAGFSGHILLQIMIILYLGSVRSIIYSRHKLHHRKVARLLATRYRLFNIILVHLSIKITMDRATTPRPNSSKANHSTHLRKYLWIILSLTTTSILILIPTMLTATMLVDSSPGCRSLPLMRLNPKQKKIFWLVTMLPSVGDHRYMTGMSHRI